ncbi:MAG: translesion error-prone DNA polymerase V autoproteolytic subunit [Gammaproteobacteria bacterium]|nr:translesion error-prone DNA polymerase V autoproteolytic subunit [Gammaproteobacteria bacterium]
MSQENSRRVGRPRGLNAYGESTKPIRIPVSKIDDVLSYIKDDSTTVAIPLYANKVSAGFPSPADDYIECKLDLNTHLIKHPAATFLLKVSGDSMQNASIHSGDMLIVDKSLEPTDGKIVIAAIDGELTVKRLQKTKTKLQLVPENPDYPVIDITEEQDVVIWGVVVHVIHQVS